MRGHRTRGLAGVFPRCRVLVVGDIMLDRYVWGEVDRISPEAPVPVVEVQSESVMLGGAGHVVRTSGFWQSLIFSARFTCLLCQEE